MFLQEKASSEDDAQMELLMKPE